MYDLVIIGSGPAGLSAAIYGVRAGLKLVVIEKDYEGTGQVALSSCVDNYLGLPGMDGYSMGEKFREHAVGFGVEFLEAEVSQIEKSSSIYVINTSDGNKLETKTVLYATGATHRKLGAPGEEKYDTKGVSYCATCDGAFYRKKTAAVIGGGDTALDDALYLSGICEKVYLIHRRDSFRAAEITVRKIKEKENIELVLNSTVTEILGTDKVTSIKVNNKLTGEDSILDVSGVFVAAGSVPSTQAVPSDVNLDPAGYIIADESGITSAPGFFTAGDVRTKALRQVITAVSDGANAVTSITHYLENM
ncbi:MAG: thioredoxin-disulfide reductase [Lachnospiraceae bacterium]|nr:thioredoxin-disulfide reductase [Lachnospiraceae bacterium]